MSKHTIQELYMYQSLPLDVKVAMTKDRIRGWVNKFGEDGVYVSFSGGKDSTVLLHMVREDYPNIPAVFVDVPTQYPELKQFAQTWDNVEILKPKMSFMQVCEKYGFPLISKEVSECVHDAKKYLTRLVDEITFTDRPTDRPTDHTNTNLENYKELANLLNYRMKNRLGGSNRRLAIMLGMLGRNQEIKENIPDKSMFSLEKYKFMMDATFEISNRCCNALKKDPARKYYKDTHKAPIIATMASESRLRTQKWLQNGCNGFDLKIPTSTPMSFWTEQDVLLYIKLHNIPICSVYGKVVEDWDATDDVAGQMTISDLEGWENMELFDADRPPLKTTGCDRTGCVLCGFGCHLEKAGEGRFERLKTTHPKFYNLLDVVKNNGVTYREAIEWINEHGNMNIRL